MNLKEAIEKVLSSYVKEKRSNAFKGNQLASFIRLEFPQLVKNLIGISDRYLVKGSAGKGVWTNVPWIAVLDRTVTDTPQRGFYLVYLFCEDGSGLYLSLNQGVTDLSKQYGSSVTHALKIKANDYSAQVSCSTKGILAGPIDLKAATEMRLGKLYEEGSIYSRYYQTDSLPTNLELESHFKELLDLYLQMVINQSSQPSSLIVEDDEEGLDVEDGTKIREHKRIERNKKLAKRAKEFHGYQCKSCGFDFEKIYGAIGKGFIEAHHLRPLATIKGMKIGLDPKKDFTVLCSNCHRMIHKTEFVDKVEEFKALYLSH